MDPTKTSRIPLSSSLESSKNNPEKKSDSVTRPSKINYSPPADHVNNEVGSRSEKNIKSAAPRICFLHSQEFKAHPLKYKNLLQLIHPLIPKLHNTSEAIGLMQKKALTTYRFLLKNHQIRLITMGSRLLN